MRNKQRSITELRRRDRYRPRYAAYRTLPDGRCTAISPFFPTLDLAEAWAERNLVGDYLVTSSNIEQFN